MRHFSYCKVTRLSDLIPIFSRSPVLSAACGPKHPEPSRGPLHQRAVVHCSLNWPAGSAQHLFPILHKSSVSSSLLYLWKKAPLTAALVRAVAHTGCTEEHNSSTQKKREYVHFPDETQATKAFKSALQQALSIHSSFGYRETDVEHRNFFFSAQKYLFCNTKKLFFTSIFLFASIYSF